MTANAAAIVRPSFNRARSKVTQMAAGDFKRLLDMADASAARLGDAYQDTVRQSADRLAKLAGIARRNEADRAAALDEISYMAFELRGEGGSFGFDVVSQVADSLYRMMSVPSRAASPLVISVIEMHALALNSLLAGGVRSATDDAVAAQILAALAAAKTKAEAI